MDPNNKPKGWTDCSFDLRCYRQSLKIAASHFRNENGKVIALSSLIVFFYIYENQEAGVTYNDLTESFAWNATQVNRALNGAIGSHLFCETDNSGESKKPIYRYRLSSSGIEIAEQILGSREFDKYKVKLCMKDDYEQRRKWAEEKEKKRKPAGKQQRKSEMFMD